MYAISFSIYNINVILFFSPQPSGPRLRIIKIQKEPSISERRFKRTLLSYIFKTGLLLNVNSKKKTHVHFCQLAVVISGGRYMRCSLSSQINISPFWLFFISTRHKNMTACARCYGVKILNGQKDVEMILRWGTFNCLTIKKAIWRLKSGVCPTISVKMLIALNWIPIVLNSKYAFMCIFSAGNVLCRISPCSIWNTNTEKASESTAQQQRSGMSAFLYHHTAQSTHLSHHHLLQKPTIRYWQRDWNFFFFKVTPLLRFFHHQLQKKTNSVQFRMLLVQTFLNQVNLFWMQSEKLCTISCFLLFPAFQTHSMTLNMTHNYTKAN